MAEIDILMAAYNGEKYIAEQIDSILAQTFQDFRLVIRDDGSTDRTPDIIAEYEVKYPGRIEVIHDDAECHSATKNFFQLLTYARADYVMFSDQDDFWLPEKVRMTLECMKKTEQENPKKPVLVFSGLNVVDADLKDTGKFIAVNLPADRYSFVNITYKNTIAGCTEMINRELYEAISFSHGIAFHDWWAAIYALAFGAVGYIPEATILYRQHGNNVVGSSAYRIFGKGGYLDRLCRIILHPSKKFEELYEKRDQLLAFRSRYSEQLSPEKLKDIDDILELFSESRLTRIQALHRIRFYGNIVELNILQRIKYILFHLLL